MPNRAMACLLGVVMCLALAATTARPAHAAHYKMVLCAANNGAETYATATNTISGTHPSGIFEFQNWCNSATDPAGSSGFLRINENQMNGNAGETAYGRMTWTAPSWVVILAAGGYTRELYDFNEGWRARFWSEDFNGNGPYNSLMQGKGVANGSLGGIGWETTSNFAPHLWPFNYYGYYHRFSFEMTCYRPAGCDRTNFNSADTNSLRFILADTSDSQVGLTNTGAPFLGGQWVRGTQNVTYSWTEVGSGMRYEHVMIDGANTFVVDHAGECNTGSSAYSGTFARTFAPCPQATSVGRSFALNTASLADGAHTVRVCTQDFAQSQGMDGTAGESCSQRTVHTDNHAPNKPAALEVSSANPARYLDHFDAKWSLPADQGSPITNVHYDIVNGNGDVVVGPKTVAGTNPTTLSNIAGPSSPGAYQLRVWLEDQVGLAGPASSAPIPHDTTPPAAPQDISVTAVSTSRKTDGVDLRWRNITDTGAPIDAVHYQVLDPSGGVVVSTQTVKGDNIEAISNLETPKERGPYGLRMWLSDAEGNEGAPVTVPLAYECVRADNSEGTALTAGMGDGSAPSEVVQEGDGSVVHGTLKADDGSPVSQVPLCVFSRVITDHNRDFLGFAITASDGGYRFPVVPGPSREVTILHRRDHRELQSHATLETVVHPTFKARHRVVYNKHFARFVGGIPGPHNDRVVIVLQARVGKGWTAFRRYRTRNNGRFRLAYRFRHTFRKTKYVMRAQVRQTVGYPYLQGNSRPLRLLVRPGSRRHKHRSAARVVKPKRSRQG